MSTCYICTGVNLQHVLNYDVIKHCVQMLRENCGGNKEEYTSSFETNSLFKFLILDID